MRLRRETFQYPSIIIRLDVIFQPVLQTLVVGMLFSVLVHKIDGNL
jgi:hypothetical protein